MTTDTEKSLKEIDSEHTNENALLCLECLASRFHQVYDAELKRQGKKSKHSQFFSKLPKDIADLDRALAKYVIEFVIPTLISQAKRETEKEVKEVLESLKKKCKHIVHVEPCNDLEISSFNKALDTALQQIDKKDL